jgi:type IV pilus assembly protein PilY1
MLRNKIVLLALLGACATLFCGTGRADNTIVKEDFTGTTTSNPWYFINGACLTAGTTSFDSTSGLGQQVGTDSNGNPIYSFPGCTKDTYYSETLVGGFNGTSGSSGTLPDPSGDGALRFTNGCIYKYGSCSNGGHNQNGAIIWGGDPVSTSSGLDITFKTITYRGDSQSNGSTNYSSYHPARNDGADGMSFFLMNGTATPNSVDSIGSYGGSLGYTCSNNNGSEADPYHGMVGGYLGLGIDEWGNFLNGTSNNLGAAGITTSHLGDNTATGAGQWSNRIGIRGGGSVAWSGLSTDPTFGPYLSPYASGSDTNYVSDDANIVRYTCSTGYLSQPSGSPILDSNGNKIPVPDYPAIAYYNLPQTMTNASGATVPVVLADEYASGGYSRQVATPITYHLKITGDAKLSLEMSYNGGAWTQVIQKRDISTLDGESLPPTVLFGFAGSTGGSTNIHEVMCFKEEPLSEASSSTTVNQQQSSKVVNNEGAQAYFGYFDPTDWSGRLTANTLSTDPTTGNLLISALGNWDASCVLTGSTTGCPTTGQTGTITAQPWSGTATGGRVILTWNGSTGIPFEWSDLAGADQQALNGGTSASPSGDGEGSERLDFLRGDRTNEVQPSGSGLFRDRDSVLADVMDSSSAWVGPPSKSIYTAYETPVTWKDRITSDSTGDTISENSGQSYSQYVTASASRLNVVYVGANDGMLHGFSAGSYTDAAGTSYDNTTNTGQEVLAYMPEGVLEAIHNASVNELDYPNQQYSHAFSVDATPGASDLYYGGAWHTWLVGGLGAGGAEIYALDVTDPGKFVESSPDAKMVVKGDWTPASTGIGSNLGYTYGTPTIRRLHNGEWGIIFGNGFGSASGDAGIYIITIDSSGNPSNIYYLSTGATGSNGIAYAYPADLDGDHIVDYVYAGDLHGNVWRFDLTSSDPTKWAVTPGPLFTTSGGQPITSQIYPVKVTGPNGATHLMLYFGTGQKFPLSYSSPTTYQSGTQSIYGVWDWNMASWNALNSTQYASLAASGGTSGSDTVQNITGLAANSAGAYTLGPGNLVLQGPMSTDSAGDRILGTVNTVCWAGTTICGSSMSSNTNFGWYINLPGMNSGDGMTTYEQIVYNPQPISTAIQFNSVLPAIDSPLNCSPDTDSGWSYALDDLTGGPVNSTVTTTSSTGVTTTTTVNFFNNGNTSTLGIKSDASGSSSVVTTTNPTSGATEYWMIYQSTRGGPAPPQNIVPPNNISGYRESWIELR